MKKYIVFAVAGVLAAFFSYQYTRDMPSATEAYYEESASPRAPQVPMQPANAVRTEPPPLENPPAATPSAASPAAPGRPITGTVSVAPEFQHAVPSGAVLYIIARTAEGGPPLAVKKLTGMTFPVKYTLGPEDRMLKARPFSGDMNILARIDRDGVAGRPQPGDMEGEFPGNPVQPGATGVDITISTVY